MKIMKYELVGALGKVKSVVHPNEQFRALGGALVQNGWLIGSDLEITVQVKLEGAENESFIIPEKAFSLIEKLPEGEVEITCDDKNTVTIRAERIKNNYKSWPASDYPVTSKEFPEDTGYKVPGIKFMEALRHVIFAASDKSANSMMRGIYFEGGEDQMKLMALNGTIVATDTVQVTGSAGTDLIVPKTCAQKLVSIGVADDVSVTYTKDFIEFSTDTYMVISRLIAGKYFDVSRMMMDTNSDVIVNRKVFIEAMNRAKLCVPDDKPIVFNIDTNEIVISSMQETVEYEERVPLGNDISEPIRIGFNSKLILEVLKNFTCEEISLNFINPKSPMYMYADDSDMMALVLPVNMK